MQTTQLGFWSYRTPTDGRGPDVQGVFVIQVLYGLSDAQAEFQILGRRSFGRFLGLDDGDKVPDETTIWRFREALVQAKAKIGMANIAFNMKRLVFWERKTAIG